MKLKGLTQRTAYTILKKNLVVKRRQATENNLDRIKFALKDINGKAPTKSAIWKSVRGSNTSKKSQMFRWRGIHEAHATGNFFARMENLGHLAMCPKCGETESLEHVLLECEAGAHETVWSIARKLWESAGETWPVLSFGLLIGCGAAQPSKEKTKASRDGQNRLFQKLVSEGSFLIWKLRNERRIEHEEDTNFEQSGREIKNRFMAVLKAAAKADFAMTSVAKYGKQAIKKELVKDTWRKLINSSSEQEGHVTCDLPDEIFNLSDYYIG
ncbi:hypothetical protein BDZ89DRAFT_1197489 [Hymenopellis radicata]|nr:hypothetical protein BDZ89DRAFT_1197489 [Hymenopellis radicata]